MFGLFNQPKLGLVLGGGGARGGAHVGGLRVLKEVGYEPDLLVGCSIGALVAACVGAGWSSEEIETSMRDFGVVVVDCSKQSDLGTTRTERLRTSLERTFGDADLRDLKPQVAVMTSDIRAGRRVVLKQGPVAQAVLASMALPGVFDPVKWNDHMLVDGGVLDNLPTQAAYELGAEKLVAIDLKGCGWSLDSALSDLRSINRQAHRAVQWLLNVSKKHYGVVELCVKSMHMPSDLLAEHYLELFPPDVLIKPDISAVPILEMEMVPHSVAAGERAAREVQPQIEALLKRRGWKRSKALPSMLIL